MVTYIIRRILQAVVTIFLVSIVVFVSIRMLPGDPILLLVSESSLSGISEEQLILLKQEHGLDKSSPLQYTDWIGGVVRGDMGMSIKWRTPVLEIVLSRLIVTLYLLLLALFFGVLLGISLGVISAVRRGTWLDAIATFIANIGITTPVFWLGMLLVYVFSLKLGWFPVMGYTSPLVDFWLSIKQLILPVLCLTVFPLASIARQTRSSMLEVMQQDYVRTAWSKGLGERTIVLKHILKNALIPVFTMTGLLFAGALGSQVLIEKIFNIPGLGRLAVDSIIHLDYPVVQGVVLTLAVSVVLINLVVDLAYGWADPRISYDK